MDKNDPAFKGQKDYGRALLAVYDWWVLGFMTKVVLRSPTQLMVERYQSLAGQRHLDVGPGSGYFIDAAIPDGTELTLLDPNRDVLDHCEKRLARFNPASVEADVLKPLPIQGPFDSIALSAVLHCLPGPMENKGAAIKNVASVLDADGVLFGGTVLGLDADHSGLARAFLKAGNKRGSFDNLTDTQEDLEQVLTESFGEVEVEVEVVGSLAVFTARNPVRP
jgi:SAM-dependent methyltransferase